MKTQLSREEKAVLRHRLAMHVRIVERAEKEIPGFKQKVERIDMMADLASNPQLDLEKLLASPLEDFSRDIWGIVGHMDRSTYPGKLTDCFVPRCSR
jgi:hypothetical protein